MVTLTTNLFTSDIGGIEGQSEEYVSNASQLGNWQKRPNSAYDDAFEVSMMHGIQAIKLNNDEEEKKLPDEQIREKNINEYNRSPAHRAGQEILERRVRGIKEGRTYYGRKDNSFTISPYDIQNKLINEIAQAIVRPSTYWKTLNFYPTYDEIYSRIIVQNLFIDEQNSIKLADAIKVNTLIKEIYFEKGCRFHTKFIEAFKTNHSVKRFIINEDISNDCINSLADLLKLNTDLAELEFGNNSYPNTSSIIKLAEALKVNTKLRRLNLSRININIDGLRAFKEAIKINKTILKIDLKRFHHDLIEKRDGRLEPYENAVISKIERKISVNNSAKDNCIIL